MVFVNAIKLQGLQHVVIMLRCFFLHYAILLECHDFE